MNIIPAPLKMELNNEKVCFDCVSVYPDCENKELLNSVFKIPCKSNFVNPAHLLFRENKDLISKSFSSDKAKDAYIITVDKTSIIADYYSYSGFVNAVSTVEQLLIDIINGKEKAELKTGKIFDSPKYSYRGLLVDCARHFVPITELKKTIKMMAFYKLNYLHLHLTDDQGWRIEIKKYPLLTQNGSVRSETQLTLSGKKDGKEYGKGMFYTQDELRELVSYAEKYAVEIIPEIDMPGHLLGAISQYPYLSCSGNAVKVRNSWGVERIIACASKEETFKFLTDVIDEVTEIFPCEYFHIGGDEVPKDEWKKCPSCQKKIKELGLKNENELQGWFENKVIDYLECKGKQVLIWDENLGVSPASKKTVLQLWRNELNRAQSFEWIKNHGKMLISYGKHFYFDYPYGRTSLKKTYEFLPENIKLKQSDFAHILGQEAAVWTEWIRNKEKYEFMLYPRMQAFAENCWSENADDYSDFEKRLKSHFEYLRMNRIDYCPLKLCNPKGITGFKQKILANLRTSDTYGEIRLKRNFNDIK